MSRNRFKFLSGKLTFDDINSRPQRLTANSNNKFTKMTEIFEKFRLNIKAAFTPGNNLCVDEQLYAFRGRCSFLQYIPSKPAKYGQKYWSLVDVASSYLIDTLIYLGKSNEKSSRTAKVGETIVKNLLEPFYFSGRMVTADNFFSTVPLAEFLFTKTISYTGTLKSNKREIPREFLANNERKLETSIFGFNKSLTLVSYVPKKNKSVILLSTAHHDVSIDTETKKPKLILDYNSNKCGVDVLDQMVEKITCRRRTKRWTMNTFMYLLDIAVNNSFSLFGLKHGAKEKTKDNRFRRTCVEQLFSEILKPCIEERAARASNNDFRGYSADIVDSFRRTGTKIYSKRCLDESPTPASKKSTRGRCGMCQEATDKSKRDNKNSNVCSQCESFVCRAHFEKINTVICKKCFLN